MIIFSSYIGWFEAIREGEIFDSCWKIVVVNIGIIGFTNILIISGVPVFPGYTRTSTETISPALNQLNMVTQPWVTNRRTNCWTTRTIPIINTKYFVIPSLKDVPLCDYILVYLHILLIPLLYFCYRFLFEFHIFS